MMTDTACTYFRSFALTFDVRHTHHLLIVLNTLFSLPLLNSDVLEDNCFVGTSTYISVSNPKISMLASGLKPNLACFSNVDYQK